MTIPAVDDRLLRAARLPGPTRKAALLQAALALPYDQLSITHLSTVTGVSRGLVTHYFFTAALMRDEVMREAVRREVLPLIASGIAARCPIALAAPRELRERAFNSMM